MINGIMEEDRTYKPFIMHNRVAATRVVLYATTHKRLTSLAIKSNESFEICKYVFLSYPNVTCI